MWLHNKFDLSVKSHRLIADNYTKARHGGSHNLIEPTQSLRPKGEIEEEAPVGGISDDCAPHDGIVTPCAAVGLAHLIHPELPPLFDGQSLVGLEHQIPFPEVLHIDASGTQSVAKITNSRALPNHVPSSTNLFIWATKMEIYNDSPDDGKYMEENNPVENPVLIFGAPLLHRFQLFCSQ